MDNHRTKGGFSYGDCSNLDDGMLDAGRVDSDSRMGMNFSTKLMQYPSCVNKEGWRIVAGMDAARKDAVPPASVPSLPRPCAGALRPEKYPTQFLKT